MEHLKAGYVQILESQTDVTTTRDLGKRVASKQEGGRAGVQQSDRPLHGDGRS